MRYDPSFYQAYIAEISLKYLVMNLAMEHCKKLPSLQAVSTFQWWKWEDRIDQYKDDWSAFAWNWTAYEYSIWSEKSLSCSLESHNIFRSWGEVNCQHVGFPWESFGLYVKKEGNLGNFGYRDDGGIVDGNFFEDARAMDKAMVRKWWYEVRTPILKLINDSMWTARFEDGYEDFYKLPECVFPKLTGRNRNLQCISPCRKYGFSYKWCYKGDPQQVLRGDDWARCYPKACP